MDPHGTSTFRFASRKDAFWTGMNMQNIPSGGGDGEEEGLELPNVRKLFIPDEGYEMCDIDLDSADLRIVAWESRCVEMQAMLNEGKKVYVEAAKEYYNDPTISKHHHSYKLFKNTVHASNYLGEASGIAGRLGLGVKEIEQLQKWYFGKFPEVKVWQEGLKRQIREKHYIENVFGYRIYFFDRITDSTYREGIASLPQSTVACLINRGWMNLYEKYPEIEVLLQVHDSLLMQYKMEKREKSLRVIKECCEVVLPYEGGGTVIPVGRKTSTISWGDAS
jgi:DNA polymerase I-like protein with 3'-5' exonuclease and polymerase domains